MGRHRKAPVVGDRMEAKGYPVFLPGDEEAIGYVKPVTKNMFARALSGDESVQRWQGWAKGFNAGLGVTKDFSDKDTAVSWIVEVSE